MYTYIYIYTIWKGRPSLLGPRNFKGTFLGQDEPRFRDASPTH